ncbi:Bug family tripartite tricarboxylate transporter substrate binding protein [Plastoroseomonas hellenica]|uniref:Bug family tripartite tricarboxylate transporter substrate binding protein n=1 Tax=Plastoroseomonas hellenica TaxID=2687306 RepID=UPI001BADBC49|nr:tripartite tricarboxylate transporter substrate-binding protein [Plastoroseomonas hellenica]MBR0647220.1 tripartite tricarboxylate transporter substrate binding protein [Plastoroseomonas hellenica]
MNKIRETGGAIRRRAMLAAVPGLALAGAAGAQPMPYPVRPVTVIVPFAPGGSTDFVARLLAQHLSATLGGPFVVENRAGAAGTVGHGAVARARPDGYTLDVAPTGTFAVAPYLFSPLPYDNDRAFSPISLLASNAMFVCVHAGSGIGSFAALLAAAKAAPGRLSYASPGTGTVGHLAPELMLDMAGIDMLHVPYRSGGLQTQALLARETHAALIDAVTALPYMQSGELRALAVTSRERNSKAPDVPALAESGLPGYHATNDFGFFAPAGTPAPIVQRLADGAREALNNAEVRARLDAAAIDVIGGSAEAFPPYLAEEGRRWGDLIRRRSIKPE